MTVVARSVAVHLCIPATGVLLCTLFIQTVKGCSTVHTRSVCAHITTLLIVEIGKVLYYQDVVQCKDAVPLQNYIEISSLCWVHTLCVNIILSFRNTLDVRGGYVNFISYIAYACILPLVIMIALESHIQYSEKVDSNFLYDARVCFADEGSFDIMHQNDVSLYLAIIRGICLATTAILFLYISYKYGCQRRNAVLCEDDRHNTDDIYARERQAMSYILLIAVTGVGEVASDLGAWYFRYNQTVWKSTKMEIRGTLMFPESNPNYLTGEWLCKSFSFCIDLLRVLVLFEIVVFEGPRRKRISSPTVPSDEGLPAYDEAVRLPNPISCAILAPPPSYTSIFKNCDAENDRHVLIETALDRLPQDSPLVLQCAPCDQQNEQPVL